MNYLSSKILGNPRKKKIEIMQEKLKLPIAKQ